MQAPSKTRKSSPVAEVVIPWNSLRAEAKSRFGIIHFRPGQREVLEAVFHRRDILALMPTGAGKSLCYQLPALFLAGPVVVVSPLLALMRDQQEKAEDARIPVEKLDSTLNAAERKEAEEAIEAGIPQLLYVTPERLANPEFIESISGKGVGILAIDEAHCISQWGHDFRPAYLGLREARRKLGDPPVLALTATASDAVVRDILAQLGAERPVIVNTGIERENLTYSVRSTVNNEVKRQRLLEMIAEEKGTGIVYTASVRTADELYEWFLANDIKAGCYHGRLATKKREAMQAGFMNGDYQVLVATKAFGMGIDKPDIRFVYHYEFPDSLESYYQEAGRAGRDGEAARAVLLYRLEDKRIQSFFLGGRYPRLDEANRVYAALSSTSDLAAIAAQTSLGKRKVEVILRLLLKSGLVERTSGGGCAPASFSAPPGPPQSAKPVEDQIQQLLAEYEERGRSDGQRLSEMMHYAESPQCRTQLLRKYFGEDEREPCFRCDNCRSADRSVVILDQSPTAGTLAAPSRPDKTAAPDKSPLRDKPSLQAGDRIRHRRFGDGKVLDLEGGNLVARFEKAGTRKIRYTYVRKID